MWTIISESWIKVEEEKGWYDNDEDDDNDEMMIVKKKSLIQDFRLYFVNIYTKMFEVKKYLENHFRELMKVLSMNILYSYFKYH